MVDSTHPSTSPRPGLTHANSLDKDLDTSGDTSFSSPSFTEPKESIENPHLIGLALPTDDPEKDSHRLGHSSHATPDPLSSDARPPGSRANSTTSSMRRQLPPLKKKETRLAQKEAHPWQHLGITLGLPAIVLFDIVVPCIIYYTWFRSRLATRNAECAASFPTADLCPIPIEQFDKDILGSAVASFGVGELWIFLARVWRLFFQRDECAPLLSRNRYELDATSWVYLVAMGLALIPFVVGGTLVLPKLYLYGPSFLMGFLGLLMLITTFCPFRIPIGINSHARGSGLRPFIYYAAEDFIAVDGLQDREFRVRYNERYERNPMFRRFFLHLTLWWMLGVCVYIGAVSAVIWTLEFHYAFGLSLGVLFSYIAVWAGVTYVWVQWEMKREHRAAGEEDDEDEGIGGIVNGDGDGPGGYREEARRREGGAPGQTTGVVAV